MIAHLDKLGKKFRDRVTGFHGVAISVSYDLYGCIQVGISPAVDKDGKLPESRWFDAHRLELTDPNPVMDVPSFEQVKGPAKGPTEGFR